MENRPSHDELRGELRCCGLPRAYIERLIAELDDHYTDLLEERNTHMGAARKLQHDDETLQQRLGKPAQLALFAAEQYRARRFWGRHPVLTFAIVPLPLFAACATSFALALVSVGYCIAYFAANVLGIEPAQPQNYPMLQGIMLGLTNWYIVVLPPLAAAVLLCRVYRRSALDWRWPLIGCTMLAIVAGLFNVSYNIATEPNSGQLTFGFGLNGSLPWILLTFLPKFGIALGIGLLLIKRAEQKRVLAV